MRPMPQQRPRRSLEKDHSKRPWWRTVTHTLRYNTLARFLMCFFLLFIVVAVGVGVWLGFGEHLSNLPLRPSSLDPRVKVIRATFRDVASAEMQAKEAAILSEKPAIREAFLAEKRPPIRPRGWHAGDYDANNFRIRKAWNEKWKVDHEEPKEGTRPPERLQSPLPGLRTYWRRYTPEELLLRYRDMDFVYSFVNGSEVNHLYRRIALSSCGAQLFKFQQDAYAGASTLLDELADTTAQNGLQGPCAASKELHAFKTGQDIFTTLIRKSGNLVDDRDRETDELRHSMRSIEQHIKWHRGRVVMVSPGHHPTWVDPAKNFLAGTCGGKWTEELVLQGTHVRVTTVHQDALMPYGMRLTRDSHVIEQNLWRVKKITPVHVYWNDDYFVNSDVAITDILNEYGGTIIRAEFSGVSRAERGSKGGSWLEGVYHTNLFNVMELDVRREDALPDQLLRMWRDRGVLHQTARVVLAGEARQRKKPSTFSKIKSALKQQANAAARTEGVAGSSEDFDITEKADQRLRETIQQEADYLTVFEELLRNASLLTQVDTGHKYTPEELPAGTYTGIRSRFFATHAPFIYCSNMFRHFSVRFEREFAFNALNHHERMARDLFIPFVYNAFAMARPWEASAKFLPYLLRLIYRYERMNLKFAMVGEDDPLPTLDVYLDNEDGCAPSTLYRGDEGRVQFTKLTNNITSNEETLNMVRRSDILFFNVNSGFNTAKAVDQLINFLHEKYPTPIYLERSTLPPVTPEDGALPGLYASLMTLPVVMVTNFEEGYCPLVRSLQLSLPDHTGQLVLIRQRYTDNFTDLTLSQVRKELRHRIVSAMPTVQCSYNTRVVRSDADANTKLSSIVETALGAVSELTERQVPAVELPEACESATGLRVRAFVIDARTPSLPVANPLALRTALGIPGQSLSLEDFTVLPLGDSGEVALVLARKDADEKTVHWVEGAGENDLLMTYPVPYEAYEDLDAEIHYVPLT